MQYIFRTYAERFAPIFLFDNFKKTCRKLLRDLRDLVRARRRHLGKPHNVVGNIFSELTPIASLLFFRKKFIEIVTEKFCGKIENRTELCR